MRLRVLVIGTMFLATVARADGPGDNLPDKIRPIPPKGIELGELDREEFRLFHNRFKRSIKLLSLMDEASSLVPDVAIFDKAIRDAVFHQEFFKAEEIGRAKGLLREGQERADRLLKGEAPWAQKTGLVVRGYRSKIDGSVQPYGLVIPESYDPKGSRRYRLDIWFHGRGETLSEVNFLHERMHRPGEFTPPDTIVLHPYGRYCNAFKFAGEVDVYEALDSVRQRYRIDDDRISVRGFSMGGAACWQFAVHDASHWFAANPGAGFAETPLFLKIFQNERVEPTWYERKLWHLYDCPDVAGNLLQCPTVAYSGELDNQKQAADVMAEALKSRGLELTHIIGPKTRHQYEKHARAEVERRMDLLAQEGRARLPRSLTIETYTLKYNRMAWLTLDALGHHWEPAKVQARILDDNRGITIGTVNVAALTLEMPPGLCPLDPRRFARIEIDGETIDPPPVRSDRSWTCSLHRAGDHWRLGPLPDGLRKKHDLQGPIDDAFMDSFVFVRPTGKSKNEKVDTWARGELDRAIEHWRRHFRGDARVVDDSDLSDEQIAAANLVLWGDPASNAVLGRIIDKLPIRWDGDQIKVGDRSFPAETHAPILIYPNPLNPARYVVLNSGFTFREYDYLNNARQVPKLPDWAIIDVRTPPDGRHPGKVVDADFFGESWELGPKHE